MKVLVVDDSRAMRNFLSAIVKDLELEVETAADGIEALARMDADGPFALALVDWDMPRMDGLSFLRCLRSRAEHSQTKVMMVTARSSYDAVSEAVKSGADDFLMKPLTPMMVADKIRILGLIS